MSLDPKSQREVAEEAGISRRQQVTAVRVANVPEETFEKMVESEKPSTIAKLAEMGKKSVPTVISIGFACASATTL